MGYKENWEIKRPHSRCRRWELEPVKEIPGDLHRGRVYRKKCNHGDNESGICQYQYCPLRVAEPRLPGGAFQEWYPQERGESNES